ncbi:conserved hypothetical protein [Candida dubliniensis CD36]|uniref:Uncharacterized protein n=1 Tax=Candida dubliniensis (strain CD36 / ATCC MYA-646 / CBS 7987 / NCPF 3949 / NRRL Y-17841) TaxID=573826 RepID=B9WK02_CANDC|nr:conserved hypothetical protein [Candida dubliniensis CD36]CAX40653.1 conserved hypothetical protein [Candida dubliniensis CD36]
MMDFSTINGDLNYHTLHTMDNLSKTYPSNNSSSSFAKSIFRNLKHTFISTNKATVSVFEPASIISSTTQPTIIPYRCENSIFRKKPKSVSCPSTEELEKSLEIWKMEGTKYSGEQRRHFKPFKVLFDRLETIN